MHRTPEETEMNFFLTANLRLNTLIVKPLITLIYTDLLIRVQYVVVSYQCTSVLSVVK